MFYCLRAWDIFQKKIIINLQKLCKIVATKLSQFCNFFANRLCFFRIMFHSQFCLKRWTLKIRTVYMFYCILIKLRIASNEWVTVYCVVDQMQIFEQTSTGVTFINNFKLWRMPREPHKHSSHRELQRKDWSIVCK